MNRYDLRNEIRRALADVSPTPTPFSDADLNKEINLGVRDACLKGLVYEKMETATFVTGVAYYNLPPDYIAELTLINPSGVALTKITPDLVGKLFIIAGKPLYYYMTQTALTYTTRANSTTYVLGEFVIPASFNGYIYECAIAGISGGGVPTYSLVPGATFSDGAVTWRCWEYFSTLHAVVVVDTPTTAGAGTGTYTLLFKALARNLYSDVVGPAFPQEKHQGIISYVAAKCCARSKDKDVQAKAKSFYLDYLSIMGIEGKEEVPQ